MPGLYKDEGVVLKTIKLGEADRIVTLFTRENGKVRAVAKGIRKTKSRFGGRLEPFTRVQLLIYRGRSLDTITQADILDSFDHVRRDYRSLTSASAMAEIVEKITPEREGAFNIYAVLFGGLKALAEDKGDSVLPAFLIKLLSVTGYNPELRACAGCGDQAFLGGFSPALGGAVCESCWTEDHNALGIPADRIELMSALLGSEFGYQASPESIDDVTNALRMYAEFHLERPLRSLQMLKAV